MTIDTRGNVYLTLQPKKIDIYNPKGEKIETIEVPAGKFECYKVTIDPDFSHFFGKWAWISFIIKPLVPDFYVWYDVEAPHPMVKFEGALGISGITAIETHELVSRKVP